MYTQTHRHTGMYLHVHRNTHTYIYMYVHVYTHRHIYIYTNIKTHTKSGYNPLLGTHGLLLLETGSWSVGVFLGVTRWTREPTLGTRGDLSCEYIEPTK